jgi:uncharacterized protein (TIGR03435 family)
LVVAKGGPKLKKSEDSEADPLPPGVPAGPDGARVRRATMMMNHNGRMEIKRTTLSGFSDMLSNMLDRAVVDQTGVEGQYDIVLDVAMEDLVGMRKMAMGAGHMPGGPGGPGGPGAESGPAPDSAPKASIFTAIQQLGLKLEPRKAPLDHLIIDQAEKVPTAN